MVVHGSNFFSLDDVTSAFPHGMSIFEKGCGKVFGPRRIEFRFICDTEFLLGFTPFNGDDATKEIGNSELFL